MKIALGLEYDGRDFSGWQWQPHRRSVQETLEKAVSFVAGERISVVCAGRTDAGVHALEQIVHFECRAERASRSWVMGCNSRLPPSIRILWATPVEADFHARSSAIARHYRYVILNRLVHSAHYHGLVTWCYRPLDIEAMVRGSRALIGEHDFTSFRAQSCQSRSPCRRLYHIGITRAGDRIVIDVVGNAFLHHMVRNIAGLLMEIGSGMRPPESSETVLQARDRKLAGVTALPDGLYLAGIYYPEEFQLPGHPHSMFAILPEGVQRYRP
ncbi:MAG: tRNA pseudouridine(38-40) synthase TruA [Gammaproteobacteria bacterium]